jgi:prepilin-type N-terminal cleavage/methylation domain-containing protein
MTTLKHAPASRAREQAVPPAARQDQFPEKPLVDPRGLIQLRTKTTAGVTLIEVLIAVSLLSVLSLAMLLAMRSGLGAMERANARVLDNRRVISTQRIMERQIGGFMPVDALCQPGPGQPASKVPFFHGEPLSMRFVSSYSLQEAARGYARILEFQVIPGENGQGVRLVVNELLYTGPESTGAACLGLAPDPATGVPVPVYRPIQIGANSFVLADRLAYCRFSFLQELPPPALDLWVLRWVDRRWPRAIRIEMAPLEPNEGRLQAMDATIPLRLRPYPGMVYADAD